MNITSLLINTFGVMDLIEYIKSLTVFLQEKEKQEPERICSIFQFLLKIPKLRNQLNLNNVKLNKTLDNQYINDAYILLKLQYK